MLKIRVFRLVLVFSLFFLASCITVNEYRSPGSKSPEQDNTIRKEKSEAPPSKPPAIKKDSGQEPRPNRIPSGQKPSLEVLSQNNKKAASSSETSTMSNQELLDSALEFCDVSNNYWEKGELDNALDALDKAYSIVLKVNGDSDPEVLQQKEDLRFTISKRIIEVYASRFTVANGHYKEIPLVMNSHVERALKLFKGRERNFFLNSYRRSGRYRPAIVAALKEAGLPEELSWLPLIESGYKVRAFSSARALGLWQFIASTGYKFGLQRDTWIDERMDPEKSTLAAIAYLKELHQIFGDWTTALAAYNCGERRVLNRIRSQRINYLDNFWDLYMRLPKETAFYVPKFLAVLHIINNPKAHGFELPAPDEEMKWEVVTINKQVHLKTIAKRLDIDYESLKSLNAELRQHLTPEAPYQLKVPVGSGEVLLAKLSDIPVWRPPVPKYYTHKVRSGDSLSRIAQKYKTSVRAIMSANGLKKSRYLKVGWRLKIPTKKYTYAAYSPKKKPVYRSKPKGKLKEYVVKKGDSLWKIASRYNTTTKAIRSLNRINSRSKLQVGQVLTISPGLSAAKRAFPIKKYRVRKGDSPYLIAKRYRMNLSEFLRLNNLTPRNRIFPGQVLLVKAK